MINSSKHAGVGSNSNRFPENSNIPQVPPTDQKEILFSNASGSNSAFQLYKKPKEKEPEGFKSFKHYFEQKNNQTPDNFFDSNLALPAENTPL